MFVKKKEKNFFLFSFTFISPAKHMIYTEYQYFFSFLFPGISAAPGHSLPQKVIINTHTYTVTIPDVSFGSIVPLQTHTIHMSMQFWKSSLRLKFFYVTLLIYSSYVTYEYSSCASACVYVYVKRSYSFRCLEISHKARRNGV